VDLTGLAKEHKIGNPKNYFLNRLTFSKSFIIESKSRREKNGD